MPAALFPAGHELAATADALDRLAARFGVQDLKTVGAEHPLPAPAKADDQPAGGGECEIARGRDIDISFDGVRCIHARFCVLGAPTVFKANTPGEWIFPDTMETEALVRVAHNCPSGAITYVRKDGGPAEAPPPVNLLRLRENGPYAFHGPLTIDGVERRLPRHALPLRRLEEQAVLRRLAQGAPLRRDRRAGYARIGAAAVRDGPVAIAPQTDGPLQVTGNLEIVSGTGRTVDRVTQARLLPLRRLAQQAVLRQHPPAHRVQVGLRRRAAGAAVASSGGSSAQPDRRSRP